MQIVILLLYRSFRIKTNEDTYVRGRFCKKKKKKYMGDRQKEINMFSSAWVSFFCAIKRD